jgi:hypothetical protein
LVFTAAQTRRLTLQTGRKGMRLELEEDDSEPALTFGSLSPPSDDLKRSPEPLDVATEEPKRKKLKLDLELADLEEDGLLPSKRVL